MYVYIIYIYIEQRMDGRARKRDIRRVCWFNKCLSYFFLMFVCFWTNNVILGQPNLQIQYSVLKYLSKKFIRKIKSIIDFLVYCYCVLCVICSSFLEI